MPGTFRSIPREAEDWADRMRSARIEKMLHAGQELLVQVVKEPGGTKGCRVSSHVTVPGRMTVLLPTVSYAGISRKIADPAERERLHAIASAMVAESGMGVIVRTAAQGVDAGALRADYEAACALWREIESRARIARAQAYPLGRQSGAARGARLARRFGRGAARGRRCAVFARTMRYARMLAPKFADRVAPYAGETPLFDLYRVDVQADRRMGRHIWLKSGGSIVIDETEALTVIDVNTASLSAASRLTTRCFASTARRRGRSPACCGCGDVGGIIVIDFIDMESQSDRDALFKLVTELMAADRNRTNVVGFTGLGLMEMTRKKVRRPLTKQLMHICSACGGARRRSVLRDHGAARDSRSLGAQPCAGAVRVADRGGAAGGRLARHHRRAGGRAGLRFRRCAAGGERIPHLARGNVASRRREAIEMRGSEDA